MALVTLYRLRFESIDTLTEMDKVVPLEGFNKREERPSGCESSQNQKRPRMTNTALEGEVEYENEKVKVNEEEGDGEYYLTEPQEKEDEERVETENEQEESSEDEEEKKSEEEGSEEQPEETEEEEGKESEEKPPKEDEEESEDEAISVKLSDPSVLNCCFCLKPLTCPVYQCYNGHIACCSCSGIDRAKKCAICQLCIGFIRCIAIEKVLDAVKTSCVNAKYGCKETFSYSNKNCHEKKCIYVPCSCPFSGCVFVASSKEISTHVSQNHRDSRIQFRYDQSFFVSLNSYKKFVIFQELSDGKLFILSNYVEQLGEVVKINCIGPSSYMKGHHYDILASYQGCSIKFQSVTENVEARYLHSPSSRFLVIPFDYNACSKPPGLEICIRKLHLHGKSA